MDPCWSHQLGRFLLSRLIYTRLGRIHYTHTTLKVVWSEPLQHVQYMHLVVLSKLHSLNYPVYVESTHSVHYKGGDRVAMTPPPWTAELPICREKSHIWGLIYFWEKIQKKIKIKKYIYAIFRLIFSSSKAKVRQMFSLLNIFNKGTEYSS